MGEKKMMRSMFVAAFFIMFFISSIAFGQSYCNPGQNCNYPPESDVMLYIGSPCDSTEEISIPVYMNNPCPVGGFQMQVVLTDIGSGVYFPVGDTLNSADLDGSRISGWGYFHFNTLSASTISVMGVGPGGEDPILPAGDGLLFTIHPLKFGPVNSCQTVRFGAIDVVYDQTGYCEYSSDHQTGTLCIGCSSEWLRGDANRSGSRNIADVIALFNHLSGSGNRLCFGGCICTGDFNHNGLVNIADVLQLFDFFAGSGYIPDPCD